MEKLRTRLILNYLKKVKSCTLEDLQRKFAVSSATIHRDVQELSRRDAVSVVRGGLVWNEVAEAPRSTSPYTERVVANRLAKIAAAKKALKSILEGDIIFLDSSTTVYELATLLKDADFAHLTIVTNSLAIMQNFRKMPREWALIGLGGNFDAQLNSTLGSATLEQLKTVNITKAYLSAFGVDEKNVTTNHERQAALIRTIIDMAGKSYLIADPSKLGRTGLYRIAPRGAFTEIFS